jgi:hypothetical protein
MTATALLVQQRLTWQRDLGTQEGAQARPGLGSFPFYQIILSSLPDCLSVSPSNIKHPVFGPQRCVGVIKINTRIQSTSYLSCKRI